MNHVSVQEAWPLLFVVALILMGQGTWLFLDARQRGGKAWFWGIWGLIQFPLPTLTYSVFLWWKRRQSKSS